MTARAEFDVGPLSWVKGEIDHAIEHAQEALRAYAANSADAAQLKSSQTHLHQAHGALSIVGLEGITRVSEELEGLLGVLESEVSFRKAEVFGLAERALGGIRTYLDQLMAGRPNQPLRLFPLYRDVVKVRGGQADPTDLYYPNLSFRPPRRDRSTGVQKPGEPEKQLRELRGRYQRGLLKWLKKDASGAEDMRAAVEAIETAQGSSPQRAFWWVSLAFFDALAHNALPADLDTKPLCNRIEQQIKRLGEGAPSVAERLMREVLYYVARAKPATDLVREVQEAYHLGQSIPQSESEEEGAGESAELKAAREHLVHAKDAWNKFASGSAPSLLAFRDSTAALRKQIAALGEASLLGLADGLVEIGEWLIAKRDGMSEAVALEVATVLLMLESALGGTLSEFAEQARLLRRRLQDCIQGTLQPTAPDIPLLDEMSRKAAERLVMNQVVGEMQANLRSIEQVLDLFFRDSAKRQELVSLDKPMRQLLGALEMLGEKRAQEALAAAAKQIKRFSSPDRPANPDEFEHIAQTLSGLGFYIEGLGHGSADFDAAMRPISAPQQEEGDAARQPSTIEAHIAEQQREAAGVYEEWKVKPEDADLRAELKKNLAALQKDAGLVADQKLETSAAEALKALDKSSTMPLTPFLREAVEKATSTAVPSPSPEATKLIDASAEAVDAELLGVYLEESDEVLATIREQIDIVREQHANKEAMVTIRRGFHTLKGSGRMVGLMRLGEAAWAIEQTMNAWLQEERAATPPLLQLLAMAHEYFSDNVTRLKAGGSSSDEHALVAAAERVRRGETPERGSEAAPTPVATQDEGLRMTIEAPAATAEPEEFVQLGASRVSTTLFTIFSGEARAHIAAIKEGHETLRQHGVVSDALLRAVHTLAGTSGTVKISALSDLGYSLKRALQVLATSELSEGEQLMVGEAIDTLEAMVAGVVELRVPQPVPALIALLDRVGEGVEAAPRMPTPAAVSPEAPVYVPEAEPVWAEPAAPSAEPAAEGALDDLDLDVSLERRQRRLDDDLDPELMQIFLDEAHELVPAVGAALRDWRDTPDNPALGQALQRVLHTLKGSSRMAGAMAIGELTHHMETRVENALGVKTLPAALFQDLETSWDRMGYLFERLHKPGAPAPASEALPATAPAGPAGAVAGSASEAGAGAPGLCNRSNRYPMRSQEVSRSWNSAAGKVFTPSAFSTRVSMWWVSSPIAMAPAMRELPLRVCRTRCSACPSAGLSGVSRQSRRAAPTAGTSSWASSRKICISSGSRSSSRRRWRRSRLTSRSRSSSAPSAAGSAEGAAGSAQTGSASGTYTGASGDTAAGVGMRGAASTPSPTRSRSAISAGTGCGTRSSTTPATMASSVSIASPTINCSPSESSLVARTCKARSSEYPRSESAEILTVPEVPASVCTARSSASLTTPCCRSVSCPSLIAAMCARASPLKIVNRVVETRLAPSCTNSSGSAVAAGASIVIRSPSSCVATGVGAASLPRSGVSPRRTRSAAATSACSSLELPPAFRRVTLSEKYSWAIASSCRRGGVAARSSCSHAFIVCSIAQAASPRRMSPTMRPLPFSV